MYGISLEVDFDMRMKVDFKADVYINVDTNSQVCYYWRVSYTVLLEEPIMSESELLQVAISELTHIRPNETFVLKDLFKGYEWNRIEQGMRSKLGTLFYVHVTSPSQKEIEVVSAGNGQRKYRRKF